MLRVIIVKSEKMSEVPKRRLAGPKNLILFSTYAFSYDGSIENSFQSDKILFSDQAIATTVYNSRVGKGNIIGMHWVKRAAKMYNLYSINDHCI